jgi:FHS family L-fucose permease-like MFS transporter
LGPVIGGYLIFQYFAHAGEHGADSVKVPYLAFSAVFALLAAVFFFIHLPSIGGGKIERGAGALRHPHVVLGMLAIFMYVGGEVSVGSAIISFLGQKSVAGLTELEASSYVSLFWGGMLIGRFMGAVQLSELAPRNKQCLLAGIPLVGLITLGALRGFAIAGLYAPFLVGCWLLFQCGRSLAARTLTLFSLAVVVLLAFAVFGSGALAMQCVIGIGLFSSIGWSNTFSLAIEGVGARKSQASSLLVTAILGGAVLHFRLQGSFVVPLLAYLYVAFYGWKGHRVGRADLA